MMKMKMKSLQMVVAGIIIICFTHSECSTSILNKEHSRLASDGVLCNRRTSEITERYLNYLRETSPDDAAIACHVVFLERNQHNSWVWSSLGSLYLSKTGSKFSSLATTCFKQANKLTGELSDHVKQWYFLGPFVIGKVEVDGDPVEAVGGIYNISATRFNRDIKVYSELVPHGEVSWEIKTQSRQDEFIKISPHASGLVDWNDIVSSLGSTGITEWQGWILGDFAVNGKDLKTIIQCLGVHTLYVDGVPMTGDIYHREQFYFSKQLSRGIHTIFIRLRTKVESVFKCTLRTASNSFTILKPHFIPDLYHGHLVSNLIAFPISNLQTAKWLKVTRVSVQDQSHGNEINVSFLGGKQYPIAPGQTRPIIVNISSTVDDIISSECSDLDLVLKFTTSDGYKTTELSLRCRSLHESFLFTFLDHDGSVQHGAAIEPLGSCDNDLCPALLTLHGTTVPPQNQADSYKHMVGGQFVFGVQQAWVVAPTRHGAHNWEGPGALTALTAVDALAELINQKPWMSAKLWNDHIVIAGHSMGGHGAWHLATHYPDRLLALISLAGWIKKEEYGDSNLFFRHDIGTSYVDPSVKAVLEMCVVENEADRHVSNLKGIPVLARIGAKDRTIHPYFVRRMYRLLKQWEVDVTYVEIPKKEHWWWDTKETNDGGCVNDKQIRDFTIKHLSLPHSLTALPDTCSNGQHSCEDATQNRYTKQDAMSFVYTVTNPSFGGSSRGLRILQQISPHRTSSIKVSLSDGRAHLLTRNVERFTISVSQLRPILWSKINIMVDGTVLEDGDEKGEKESALCLRRSGSWEAVSDCATLEDAGELRGPLSMGPARRVAERHFLIVPGTQGDPVTSLELQEAAVYIANLFFLTGDGQAPVVKDTDLTDEDKRDYNLILIGTPAQNLHTSNYLRNVPLTYQPDGSLGLGNCSFSLPHTGALFLCPTRGTPGGHLNLVLMANDIIGLRDVISLATPTIPPMTRSPFSNLVPDFVITGPDFRAYGAGGYQCTGFWDNNWKLKAELISCSYCTL